jgi:phage terminase Nu1 subunit (DNA packaging protein)
MKLLSLRGYARHRGVTLRAVQKAIESGRIQTTEKNGKVFIDADAADKRWAALTDPAKQREQSKAADVSDDESDDSDDETLGHKEFFRAKTKKEKYQARLAKLKYQQLSGKLIPADEVKTEWQKLIAIAKTRLLAVSSKARGRIPHLTAGDIATIDEEIRAALEGIAGGGGS